MDHPLASPEALLPRRWGTDEELQVQAHCLIPDHCRENRQLHFLTQLVTLKVISFFSQASPALPISNDFLAPPPLENTIPLRRRLNKSRGNRAGTRSSTLSQYDNDISIVDEQIERVEDAKNKSSPCGTSFSDADIRVKKHNVRVEALKQQLKPMLPENGSPVVLLCWGEEFCCTILPVLVPNYEDEIAAWEEINRTWYRRRGNWRKYLGFSVTRVDVVEVCFNI